VHGVCVWYMCYVCVVCVLCVHGMAVVSVCVCGCVWMCVSVC